MSEHAPLDAGNLRAALRPVQRWPDAATLWDPGDGAAIFELTRPDALITPEVIRALASYTGLAPVSGAPSDTASRAVTPNRL